jgi:hypothetical protein
MTHFAVLIFVPDECTISEKDYIKEKMAPFEEDTQDQKFLEFNVVHRKESFEESAHEIVLKHDDFQNLFDKGDYVAIFDDWYGSGELNGQGDWGHWHNPNTLWDWYRVGGRWDGVIAGNEQRSEGGFNFSKIHETIGNNAIKAVDLLKKYQKKPEYPNIISTVIDLDGKLHTSRNYGWWGTYTEAKSDNEWRIIYEKLLRDAGDCYVVLLDCHI